VGEFRGQVASSLSTTGSIRSWNFLRFVVAQAISRAGSALAPIALAFAVLESGSQASSLAVILAANSIPQLLMLILGGVFADRRSRGAILVGCNAVAGASQFCVALAILNCPGSPGLIACLSAISGAAAAFGSPALQGAVPQLVGNDELRQANALLRIAVNAARVGGPVVGGILVSTCGPVLTLAIDALSFLVAAMLLVGLGLPNLRLKRRMSSDLRLGWRMFSRTTWIWTYSSSGIVVVSAWLAGFFLLGPVVANIHYGGAKAWGVIQTGFIAGMLGGALLLIRVRLPRPVVCATIGSIALSGPLFAMALSIPAWVVFPSAVLAGVGQSIASVGWATAIAQNIPVGDVGKVVSWVSVADLSAAPIAYILVGVAADRVGPQSALLVCGALLTLACVSILPVRSIWLVR
jgi:MFS family permease